MASLSTDGLVLRRANYGDYDRMVTLFSPTMGKIDAVARGCRKAKSPLLNATEPFTCGEFQLYEKAERFTIEQCRITENYYELRMDYDRLKHGVYWLKLLESSLMPDVPMQQLFLTVLRALAYLNYSDIIPQLLTFDFELHLMRELGLSPAVESCRYCGKPINGDSFFDPIHSSCSCAKCRGNGIRISNGARRIIMKAPRTSFDKVELLVDHPDWKEAARVFREYVDDKLQQRKFAPPTAE